MGNHFREPDTFVQNKPTTRRHVLKSMAGLAAVGAVVVSSASEASDAENLRAEMRAVVKFFRNSPDNCMQAVYMDRQVTADHIEHLLRLNSGVSQ